MLLNAQFDQVFQFLPNPSLILLPDAPKFTIVAANRTYLETSGSLEKDLIGKGIFEAFPENPEDSVSNGVKNLRNSLNFVIAQKGAHKMPLQKYDIPIRGTSKFKVKYFNPQNIPVKDDNENIIHIFHSVEDVTDKKNMEISFETERQRFNDLYLQAPSYMGILKGPNHVFEFANTLYLQLIGVNDVIGKTVTEVFPEFETQGILKFLDAVYETGESFSAKEMLVKYDKKGEEKIVEIYQDILYQPHKDINGTIDGIFFFFIDVTEKVASRKKIEASEKSLKESQEVGQLGNWELNIETGISIWSDELCKIYGLLPSENIQSFESWLSFIHPDDLEEVLKIINESQKTLSESILNHRIVLKDGTVKNTFGKSKYAFSETGEPIRIYGIALDVTESTKTEEKVRFQADLLNIITQAAICTNAFGIINFWNKAATEIYGWTAEEALGKNVISLISTEQKEGDTKEIMEKLSQGNSSNEFVVKHKDGHTFSVFSAISPIYSKQGKFEGTIEVSMDITGKKRTEEKLEKQKQELYFQNEEKQNRAEELFVANKELAYQNGEKEKRADELILANIELEFQNREKENRAEELSITNKELVKTNIELDRFVYSVSHDLRSPLTSILGLISLIEEDSRELETLEQVKMIRTSINRLDGFIKNILSYSQNNRTVVGMQKIPIKKTINEIVASVRNIKEAKGISFQIDIDEKKPFYSDWQRFNTILENLIANAIKYHTKEVPGRYLKLTGISGREELKLSICDNGIGIAPEFHEKIFEMFYRLPGNTDGSGFGLYIVKETLEKIQGKIEVQSEKGVGTTFIITLKNLKE